MELKAVGSGVMMLLATLLFIVAAGLPKWSTVRLVSSEVGVGGAVVVYGGNYGEDFDCVVGAGLFMYNHRDGTCGDLDDFPQWLQGKNERDTTNAQSTYEMFSTTDEFCNRNDPDNTDFIPVPGNAFPPTPLSLPPTNPITIPTPAASVPAPRSYATNSFNCNVVRTCQAFAVLAVLFALLATAVSLAAGLVSKVGLYGPAAFLCFLTFVCGIATVQMYEKFAATRIVLLATTSANTVDQAANTFFNTNVGTVNTNPYGQSYGCEIAGIFFTGWAGILLFVSGQVQTAVAGSSNQQGGKPPQHTSV